MLGRNKQQQAAKLFLIEVLPTSGPLEVSVTHRLDMNGSIKVEFSANRDDGVSFQCSVGGNPLFGCKYVCLLVCTQNIIPPLMHVAAAWSDLFLCQGCMHI